MPKPVTLYDPVVRAQGGHERSEHQRDCRSRRTSPTSSTACNWPGKFLAAQDTPNRQIMLITDGLPTAHFEGEMLYLLYPPDPRTEDGDAARGPAVRPRGHHDQHLPAVELEPVARRTCASPTGWRNRRAAGCSSRPAASWIATSSGITSSDASRLSRDRPASGGADLAINCGRLLGRSIPPVRMSDRFPSAATDKAGRRGSGEQLFHMRRDGGQVGRSNSPASPTSRGSSPRRSAKPPVSASSAPSQGKPTVITAGMSSSSSPRAIGRGLVTGRASQRSSSCCFLWSRCVNRPACSCRLSDSHRFRRGATAQLF